LADYRYIRLEDRGFMTWLVLDRPDAANALSHGLLNEFSEALRSLQTGGPPVIGIRGEGRGFSAGYDLAGIDMSRTNFSPVQDRERLQGYVESYLQMWDHPKPIIAAVHGYCIGGATQMCAYADLTVVAEDAHIGQAKIPVGGGFVTPLWVPLVGPKRAKEIAFIAGNAIDGRTAVEWGWANRAVTADRVISTTEELAQRIAHVPADVLRIKKLSINRAAESTGPRGATSGVADMDVLVHATPAVQALREWVAKVGVKAAVQAYKSGEGIPDVA
jgi:enoyl-CoA hydratase